MSQSLQQILDTRDMALIRLAFKQGQRPQAEHLMALLETSQPPTPALVRLIVEHGANPYEGLPSPLQVAQQQKWFSLAWTMEAAWQQGLIRPA